MKKITAFFRQNRGFSLIEVMVVLTMISVVLLPLFFMKWRTTRQAFDIRKHIIASQIGRSILDRFLACNFNDCLEKLQKLEKVNELKNDPMISEVSSIAGAESIRQEFLEVTKTFFYIVYWETDNPNSPSQISICVEVDYSGGPDAAGQGAYVDFEGVKIRE
ncbi:MAG: prepilin-type N-terminal cleavage/methylation domain-containing protein [Candidatus Riflebacteria bacterium]|nr:prepilin-type N-terminal cleavage/methylation domain-containing protein [Candidatus Riflebacteria bacterium]